MKLRKSSKWDIVVTTKAGIVIQVNMASVVRLYGRDDVVKIEVARDKEKIGEVE